MALSVIVKKLCPECSKPAVEKSRMDLGSYKIINLECGHMIYEDVIGSTAGETIMPTGYHTLTTQAGWKLRQYQVEGAEFIERANGRVLIGDEMGLGKTAQPLAVFKFHPGMFPVVWTTKTALKHQTFYEGRNVIGDIPIQIINSGKDVALPGMSIYILTYDMLKNHESIFKYVKPKTLVVDECQAIKNHLSDRAKAVQTFSLQVEHIIGLSGTAIKNNAGEYFTILNVLQPTRFPEYRRFLRDHCDSYDTMYTTKVGGLRDPEYFKELTQDFIIRRTRAEAAPELPTVDRQFFHVELDRKFNNAYNNALEELDEMFYSESGGDTMSMIAIMTKLRRITGLSKAPECAEWVENWIENNPEKKITIFAHHKGVVALLQAILIKKGIKVLNLNANLDGYQRSELIEKFKTDSEHNVMIASTLAAGEGLNLQFCDTAIMLERQWNPANEGQAEGRFIRLGQLSDRVQVIYMLATETIDEYFTELVEQKRAIVESTLDNKQMDWDSNSLMKELASVLVSKGKKKWSLTR